MSKRSTTVLNKPLTIVKKKSYLRIIIKYPSLTCCMILYLQALEEKERKTNSQREQLRREQRFLQRRLESLLEGQYRVRQERSISECSTSTNSTTSSNSESGKIYCPLILAKAKYICTREPLYNSAIGLDKGGYPVNIFLISPRKHVWVLIRSASVRCF